MNQTNHLIEKHIKVLVHSVFVLLVTLSKFKLLRCDERNLKEDMVWSGKVKI